MATRRRRSGTTPSPPYKRQSSGRSAARPTEREQLTVDDAVSIIQRDYYDDVRGIGKDVIRATKDGEITDSEDFQEYLHDSVDGSQRVIYTFQAQLGLLATKNADVGLEDGIVELRGDSIPWEQLMYAALERDVIEYLESEGYDPNDPRAFLEEDDED